MVKEKEETLQRNEKKIKEQIKNLDLKKERQEAALHCTRKKQKEAEDALTRLSDDATKAQKMFQSDISKSQQEMANMRRSIERKHRELDELNNKVIDRYAILIFCFHSF